MAAALTRLMILVSRKLALDPHHHDLDPAAILASVAALDHWRDDQCNDAGGLALAVGILVDDATVTMRISTGI